jgi:hypothetical protein
MRFYLRKKNISFIPFTSGEIKVLLRHAKETVLEVFLGFRQTFCHFYKYLALTLVISHKAP